MKTMKKTISLFAIFLIFSFLAVMPFSADVVRADDATVCVLHDCDTTSFVRGTYFTDRTNFIQGNGCLFQRAQTVNLNLQFHLLDHSLLPDYENAYLEFYLWVENKSIMANCVIELNSSLVDDLNEKTTNILNRIGNGWNYISVRVRDLSGVGGVFDYANLRAFRIYSSASSAVEKVAIRLDYMIMTDRPNTIEKESIVSKSEPRSPLGTVPAHDYYNGKE